MPAGFTGPLCVLLLALGALAAPAARALPTTAFLSHYWRRPLVLGGPGRPHWPAFETALSAQACGQCHIAQYRAWRMSRHAQAMGPGVIGQLAAAGLRHWRFVDSCLSCHAPAGRQGRMVRAYLRGGALATLARQGVSCADCHVRLYQRFGPPLALYLAAGRAIHNGFTPRRGFLQSRFCISCHQFHRNGRRLDGVLLENTYNEWRHSPYAAAHITCQSCHMRNGQHSFRGIHNPRFVRRALAIHLRFAPRTATGDLRARLSITNTGVGHDFPTYTTPQVRIAIWQSCPGRVCPKSVRTAIIGRRISLDLRHQYYDTRLPPDTTRVIPYRVPQNPAARALNAAIVVYPDAAYVRFFRAYLARYHVPPRARTAIREALAHDERSAYLLWQKRLAVPGAQPRPGAYRLPGARDVRTHQQVHTRRAP